MEKPRRCPRSPAEKKRGFLAKTVERCRSLRRRPPSPCLRPSAPAGCFAVLVGPERERFVVRAESANHPLFRALLDEAEAEYGSPRAAVGPLLLPCGAEEFRRVMSEVERDEEEDEDVVTRRLGRRRGG